MKKLIKATVVTLTLSLSTLYAGSGHSHDNDHGHNHTQEKVSKSVIQKTATQKVLKLVKNKKIDKSWLDIAISEMNKKKFNSKNEWIITYNNTQIKNKSKQTLYIFINEYGKVTGANYTGK